MKCENCGGNFSARDAQSATRSEASEAATMEGQKTRLVTLSICPNCAASRASTRQLMIWMVILFPIGLALVGLLGSYLATVLR
jgi:hypothetical protein